jgi:riboflavin kinase/FMN adenylyltransferase
LIFGAAKVRSWAFSQRACAGLRAEQEIGTRPTFDGTKPILEVHIFDFDEDIYGEYIHVDFIARLRGQEKYARIEDLVAQMHRDADNAKAALAAAAA